jgi:predicted AAA+ superfamily ATPase
LFYQRKLNLNHLLAQRSYFLFGPRACGKTSLILKQLPEAQIYDLLDSQIFNRLVRRPSILEEENTKNKKIIVIDEIQKLPSLLDEVQRLIVKNGFTFLLTGSSARKLVHSGANLLAGRALKAELFPLVSIEIPDFDLLRYLNRGGIPEYYINDQYRELIEAYVDVYLRDEIQREVAVRKFEPFAQFLDLLALSNGEEINFSSFASDCGTSPRSIQNYFQVLYDTLLGYALLPFVKTKKRKAITRAKFYFFDIGIANFLANRGPIQTKSELFGKAFEHFIIGEVRAYNSYARKKWNLGFWRSTSGFEVDLTVENIAAIEIKASDLISDKHLKGLKALHEEQLFSRYIVISLDPNYRKLDNGIEIYPWKDFLSALWQGELGT